MAKYNNETYGMSFEKFLCDIHNVQNTIEPCRCQTEFIDKLYKSNISELLEKNNILIVEHQGKDNGDVDFKINLDNRPATLSAKTTMGKHGKICPQGGQPTYKSFDRKRNLTTKTANLDRQKANCIRFEWLKNNIHSYLNEMQARTFCCDCLLYLNNCKKNPQAILVKNKKYDFTKMKITYSRPNYEKKPHKKKPAPATTEFSTTIYAIIDGKTEQIGEFQFHKSSRQQVKFRFYSKLFH